MERHNWFEEWGLEPEEEQLEIAIEADELLMELISELDSEMILRYLGLGMYSDGIARLETYRLELEEVEREVKESLGDFQMLRILAGQARIFQDKIRKLEDEMDDLYLKLKEREWL